MAQAFAPICTDPTAQTVEEIRVDLEGRGIYSKRVKILRWVTRQIEQGKMEQVKVLRTNSNGVVRPVSAYRVIESDMPMPRRVGVREKRVGKFEFVDE